jgi:hypothetical protein
MPCQRLPITRTMDNTMKTYEQRKAELPIKSDRFYKFIGDWEYSKNHCFARNLKTHETFTGTFDEFLIEKRFIDYLNCDEHPW